MRKEILAVCLIVVGWGGSATAYDKTNLQALKVSGNCIGCDLSGADLSWLDLRGSELTDADLAGAVLSNTKFEDVVSD